MILLSLRRISELVHKVVLCKAILVRVVLLFALNSFILVTRVPHHAILELGGVIRVMVYPSLHHRCRILLFIVLGGTTCLLLLAVIVTEIVVRCDLT